MHHSPSSPRSPGQLSHHLASGLRPRSAQSFGQRHADRVAGWTGQLQLEMGNIIVIFHEHHIIMNYHCHIHHIHHFLKTYDNEMMSFIDRLFEKMAPASALGPVWILPLPHRYPGATSPFQHVEASLPHQHIHFSQACFWLVPHFGFSRFYQNSVVPNWTSLQPRLRKLVFGSDHHDLLEATAVAIGGVRVEIHHSTANLGWSPAGRPSDVKVWPLITQ